MISEGSCDTEDWLLNISGNVHNFYNVKIAVIANHWKSHRNELFRSCL